MNIPFNRPYYTGDELKNISALQASGRLSGDGEFTKECQKWLNSHVGICSTFLTHSCTAALEMCALLLGIEPGDEIIMPSYTFVSTANAFALRGGVPVFVDVRPDTCNIDEQLIEGAITSRTKAIVPVHYAGVSCEMDTINAIAKRYGLMVVEDAAQGLMAFYKGKALGSLSDLGAFSFHETKNISSGEGGALLINSSSKLRQRAEILREKGTDRSRFFRGEVDKYTWQDIGSSYLPSDIIAAFLLAQLNHAREITEKRLQIWDCYHRKLRPLGDAGKLIRPHIPENCLHNAHIYYIRLSSAGEKRRFIERMKRAGIQCTSHYVPLHLSPVGSRIGRVGSSGLVNTVNIAETLVRLPLWPAMDINREVEYVVSSIYRCLE